MTAMKIEMKEGKEGEEEKVICNQENAGRSVEVTLDQQTGESKKTDRNSAA